MDGVLKFLGYVLASAISIAVTAFTLATVWGWFVVPLGVVPISYVHAYGISILTSLFSGYKEKQDTSKLMIHHLAKCIVVLLFGYVTVQFM